MITVNGGGTCTHYLGNLVAGGGSRTTVNPGRHYHLLLGSELDLNGALLVNNGTINGTTNVNYGSLATGSGSYGVVNVNTGGVFSPGNSPGIVTAESLISTPLVSWVAPPWRLSWAVQSRQRVRPCERDWRPLARRHARRVAHRLHPRRRPVVRHPRLGQPQRHLCVDQFADAGGLVWNTSQLYESGVFSVRPRPRRRLQPDGIVDAADYVVWRKSIGTQNAYNVWRAHFGQTVPGAGSGSAANANVAVPEPAAAVMFAVGMLLLLSRPSVARPPR